MIPRVRRYPYQPIRRQSRVQHPIWSPAQREVLERLLATSNVVAVELDIPMHITYTERSSPTTQETFKIACDAWAQRQAVVAGLT